MPSVGVGCHELRLRDSAIDWRVLYRVDSDTILVIEIFQKKTQRTPKNVIKLCQTRLAAFDRLDETEE